MDRMSAGVTEKLFTVEEYHRMAEAGILRPGDRMELIEGKIIQMSAIGHRHFVSVMRAHTFLMETLERRILLSIQGPIRLSDWTEPEPDLVIFKPRADFYAQKRPTPADVFFIVEVSDTSLTYDQRIKLPGSRLPASLKSGLKTCKTSCCSCIAIRLGMSIKQP